MEGEKYVVIKTEDWQLLQEKFRQNPNFLDTMSELHRHAVDDAVVIRRQDVFAPPALAAYANGIHVALAVAGLHEQGSEPTELTKRLRRVADYFHDQSERAYHENRRKLPD